MSDLSGYAALGVLPGTTGAVDPTSAYPIAGDAGLASGTGTGQHGVTPIVSGGNGMNGGLLGEAGQGLTGAWSWLNTPFKAPLSPFGIALIVGAIIISVPLWNMFLYHVRIAAETI